MKKILNIIKQFVREDFDIFRYLLSIFFLIVFFAVYYSGATKNYLRDNDIDFSIYYLTQLIFTFIIFYIISLKKANIKTIIFIVFSISILYLNYSSKSFASIIFKEFDLHYSLFNWFRQTFINFQKALILILPLIISFIFQIKHLDNFYGFSRKNFDFKPYLIMLLIMTPLIIIASFDSSFQKMYPRYKPGSAEELGHISTYLSVGLFEATYWLRFLGVEFFWRGLMVLGGVALLGKRAILPAACLYSVWHFGKPMGEAIGAFFGGYILGILAYRTRSIYGGIAIHYGVALLMELAAWSQILFFDKE